MLGIVPSITVLVVTLWFHVDGHQGATSQTIVASDYEECVADSPAVEAGIKKTGLKIGGKKTPIEHIAGVCLTFELPKEA